MKLYTVPRSPNSKKILICAEELGLSLEIVPLDFRRGDLRTPEYLAKNPMAAVPTLDDNGFVLWESAAILVYLAERHPQRGLMPADPCSRADVMRWLFWYTCHVQPYMTMLAIERVLKPMMGRPGNDSHVLNIAQPELTRVLPVLEQQLERTEYVTSSYSVADIAMGCAIEASHVVEVDLAPYPRIQAWLDRIRSRPAWQKLQNSR